MRIGTLIRQAERPFFSLEFFPPAEEGQLPAFYATVEELRALHLDVPQAAELCHALTAAGCPMADDIIDVEECAAALYELLTGKKAPGAAQEKAEEVSACPQS